MTERGERAAVADGPPVEWLDDAELALWHAWIAAGGAIHLAIQRDLRANTALSEPDFEVLATLTSRPDARWRMGDMARAMSWEPSRLSHQVTRMESRGLVARLAVDGDRRGAVVEVTATGREAIAAAAPGHVATVRAAFFARLSARDRADLARILDRLTSPAAGPAVGR